MSKLELLEVPDIKAVLEAKRELDLLVQELTVYLDSVNELKTHTHLTDLLQARECAITYDQVVDCGEGDPIVFSWSKHPRVGPDYEVDQTFYLRETLEAQCRQMDRCPYSFTECEGCGCDNEQTAVYRPKEYPYMNWCQSCYVEAMINSNPPKSNGSELDN